MMTHRIATGSEHSDTELVSRSLAGDREAFGRIVSRYQTLICSLAYSRIGNLGQSEDVAQETFITAWKHLRLLREPAKLRAWLCGIVRNRVHKHLQREGREPAHQAEALDAVPDSLTSDVLPSEAAAQREEESILWRSLQRIPEIYREPLILFYREQRSIEAVAGELELSEDAVKQRLVRGRRLLHEEVLAFVEGALERTNPGKPFTLAVLATLPLLTTSAKAATVGAAAVKGVTMAKGAALVGLFNAIIGPVLGFLGPWLQYRAFLAAAQTEHQRCTIRNYYRRLLVIMLGFCVLLVALIIFGGRLVRTHPPLFAGALIALVTGYIIAAAWMGAWANRMFREFHREHTAPGQDHVTNRGWEYRSKLEWLGLPLVHFRFSPAASPSGRGPVKAWIAAGDSAFGLLFAFGGLAIAPFSVGGIAIGLMPWGGAAVGLFALGGFAFGGWVFGGFAVGWQAFGGCALAWNAAMGGLAIAREVALGGVAHAAHVKGQFASEFMKASPFFSRMETLSHYVGWLNLLWLIPLVSWRRILARQAGMKPGQLPPIPNALDRTRHEDGEDRSDHEAPK
ncbi:MAG TPA: RNA polymerase sigma factor [Verrucomicrobiae bacterium]|nr:RNA polymerase sigma factor [Verrucomicrobiae bacterium]